jgi:hypothetical protein
VIAPPMWVRIVKIIPRVSAVLDVTHEDEVYKSIHFCYIMKENGYGKRKVEVVKGTSDSYYRKMWSDHPRYVKYVKPWELGGSIDGIPSYAAIASGKKPFVT